jgi:hypothetical protein
VKQVATFFTHSNHFLCQHVLNETKISRNIRQQEKILVSLLSEIRLNENEGTHRTSVRIRNAEILIVPICVTEANWPLRSLTNLEIVDVMVVKKEMENTI